MKKMLRYPALVRGIPHRQRDERLCLVSGEAEFEIRELDLTEMPLAMRGNIHYLQEAVEFRMFEGALYKNEDFDLDQLEIEFECQDVMAHGHTNLYSRISNEIVDIMSSGRVAAWPKDGHLHRQRGARPIETSGLKEVEGSKEDLLLWKERFKSVTDGIIVADGRCWVRVPEPVLEVNIFQEREVQLELADLSVFYDRRGNLGERSGTLDDRGVNYRIFPVTERHAALEAMDEIAAELGIVTQEFDTVEVFIPQVLGADVDRLELDRLGRVAVNAISKNLAKTKPGGGGVVLEIAPSGLVRALFDLRDLLESYNPEDGIPERLEEAFVNLLAEADVFAETYGSIIVSERLRKAVDYSFGRWENRRVSIRPDVGPKMVA